MSDNEDVYDKTEFLGLRLYPHEKKTIKRNATLLEISMSDYVALLLKTELILLNDFSQELTDLYRIHQKYKGTICFYNQKSD